MIQTFSLFHRVILISPDPLSTFRANSGCCVMITAAELHNRPTKSVKFLIIVLHFDDLDLNRLLGEGITSKSISLRTEEMLGAPLLHSVDTVQLCD